jgi:hypothetical protein
LSELEIKLFSPSQESGIALRESLNRDFALSFEHVFEACGEHFEIPERQIAALLSRIRTGSRETPYIFSLHFKLLEAIRDARLDDAQALISRILSVDPADPGILVTGLGPHEFPWDGEIVAGYFVAESDSAFRYAAPAVDALPLRKAQLDAALDLIRHAAPGLAAELEEVITTIILARRYSIEDGSEPDEPFFGASALRAFGAIFSQAEPDHSVVHCAASLIHEEAHTALFALSPMEGVVTNADGERYSSPLREDPRPLEGIFHATFVLARIVYGMEAMRSSGRLSSREQAVAAEIVETSRPRFFDGLATLRRHATLTARGRVALEDAETYMAAFV